MSPKKISPNKTTATSGVIFTLKSKIFWLVIFAAIALRLVYYHQVKDVFLFGTPILDAKYYNDWAVEIAKGDLLGTKRGVFMMSPGYSYFLGGVYGIFGVKMKAVVLVQFALGILTGILTYLLGKRFFSKSAGLVAMVFFLFYGMELFYESMLVKTTLINFTNMLSLFLLASGTGLGCLLSGALLGFSAHLRPNALIFAPVAVFWLLYNKEFPKTALFVIGTLMILLPCGIRNYMVGKEFVLTTTHGGMNFYTGNSKFCLGPYTPMPFARTDPEFEQDDFHKEANRLSKKTLSPKESSSFWYGESFKFIKKYPVLWLELIGKKVLIFFNSYEPSINLDYYFFKSIYHSALSLPLFNFGVILSLAAMGMLLSSANLLLLTYIAVYFISGIIFFVVSEYRFPVVPVICVYAGSFIVYLAGIYRKKGTSMKFLGLCAGALILMSFSNYDIYSSVFNFTNYKRANLASAYFVLGVTYEEKSMEKEAVNAYETAINIMPQASPLVNLAIIHEKRGDFNGAQTMYERALSVNPNSTEALYNLGTIFFRNKNYKSAEICFSRAVMINPNFEQASENLEITRKAIIKGFENK